MTKILAVATLVLSIIYFGVTATLFSYRVNYKTLYEKEKQAHQSTKKSLEEERDKLIKEKEEILNQLAHTEAEKQLYMEKTQTYSELLKKNTQEFTA
jgi:small-conductance mechanosensitive channel